MLIAATAGMTLEEQIASYTMHHILDAQKWYLPGIPPIYLPDFLSLHQLMLLLGGLFLIIIFVFLYNKKSQTPRGLTNFLEVIIIFIRDEICKPTIGEKDGEKLTPLFCTFFFYILILNLMGLIPLFVGTTQNVNITAGLALSTLTVMIVGSIKANGFVGFLKAFMPSGVPWPILIILFPIEFISMFVKTFALTVRLFANMLAGHIVILSLIGLFVIYGMYALPAFALIVFIYILKIFVAFLQAYIFTMFSSLFVGQLLHPDH